jgi:hypothetical protein
VLFVDRKRNGELDLKRVNNRARDFILERKHSCQFAVVGFRPKMKTAAGIYQFRGNTNVPTLASQTSCKHIRDVQLFSNIARVHVLSFE